MINKLNLVASGILYAQTLIYTQFGTVRNCRRSANAWKVAHVFSNLDIEPLTDLREHLIFSNLMKWAYQYISNPVKMGWGISRLPFHQNQMSSYESRKVPPSGLKKVIGEYPKIAIITFGSNCLPTLLDMVWKISVQYLRKEGHDQNICMYMAGSERHRSQRINITIYFG